MARGVVFSGLKSLREQSVLLKREVAKYVKDGETDFMLTQTWDNMLLKIDSSGGGNRMTLPGETAVERRND